MVQKIKKVSKFSEDAIAVALGKLPEKDLIERGLDSLIAALGEKKCAIRRN